MCSSKLCSAFCVCALWSGNDGVCFCCFWVRMRGEMCNSLPLGLSTADLSHATGGVNPMPVKRSPPTPPKRTTPVNKRYSLDPQISPAAPDSTPAPATNPAPAHIEEKGSEPQSPPPTSPEYIPDSRPPSHIPPSPPRSHSPVPLPIPQAAPIAMPTVDPPSPTTEPPKEPPIPLHLLIQRALANPGRAPHLPDRSKRAHSLLFETPQTYLSTPGERASLPVTIERIKL